MVDFPLPLRDSWPAGIFWNALALFFTLQVVYQSLGSSDHAAWSRWTRSVKLKYQIRSPSGVISIAVTAAEDRILSERAAVNQRLKKVAKYAAQPLGQHTQTSVRPARTLSFFILGQKSTSNHWINQVIMDS